MSNELKKYKVMGYTTDFNKCDCCGKENLKGTVSILHFDSGVVMHFGSVCAAAADKYDTLEAAREAKREVNKVVNQFKESQRFGWSVAWKLLRKKYGIKATETAPKDVVNFLVNDCEKWYTNPDNKFKPYPVTAL